MNIHVFHHHDGGCWFYGLPIGYWGTITVNPQHQEEKDVSVRPDLSEAIAVLVSKRIIEKGSGRQRIEGAPVVCLQACDHFRRAFSGLGEHGPEHPAFF